MKKKFQNTAVAFGVFLMLSGCATTSNPSDFLKQTFASDDPCSNNSRNIGIAVGAIGGTILAKVSGGSNNESLLLGAAAGSLVGGLIGADMDRRRCELSKIAKQFDLDITFNDIKIDNSITLNESNATANETTSVPKFPAVSTVSVMAVRDKEDRQDRGHFKTGSDQLTPKAQEYFGAIAEQYARNLALESEKDKTKRDEALKQYSLNRRILLVGHTDDTGSSQLNADLSERRAHVVAEYLKRKGVPESNIYFQGAGEAYPVANNRTEEGRAINRRVEIIEAADESAFKGYLVARKPNLAMYRAAPDPTITDSATASSSKPVATVKADEISTKTTSSAAEAPIQAKRASSISTAKKTAPTPVSVASNVKDPSTSSAAIADKNRRTAENLLAVTGKTTSPAKPVKASPAGQTNTGNQASPSLTTAAVAPSNTAEKSLGEIDFGGTPANAANLKTMDIGQQISTNSAFGFISNAYAADDVRSVSCAQDRPRHVGDVKNFATGKTYSIREYMPGTARATWGAKVNGHFVGLTPVAVLRDGTTPPERPNLLIFKNWTSSPTPDSTIPVNVNAYVGDKGLLYRAFPEKGPIKCIDMLIDRANPNKGIGSNIIYARNSVIFQADYNPTITRN